MRDRGAIGPVIATALAGLILLGPAADASAHITKVVGPLRVSIGWGNEPAIAGLQNFVEVGVTDASGRPVSSANLEVQVAAAGARTSLPVRPGEEPGAYAATLIPTRPGTYSFHLTGRPTGRDRPGHDLLRGDLRLRRPRLRGRVPCQGPLGGELAQRLSRELPRAEQGGDGAEQAKTIAIAALAVAAVAIALGLRSRRKT